MGMPFACDDIPLLLHPLATKRSIQQHHVQHLYD
jgi:hypothetical protein